MASFDCEGVGDMSVCLCCKAPWNLMVLNEWIFGLNLFLFPLGSVMYLVIHYKGMQLQIWLFLSSFMHLL